MPVNQPTTLPATATPQVTSPKPTAILSPALVSVPSNQSAVAPSPIVKVNQTLPAVSHTNSTNVSVIAPAVVTPASNASQAKTTTSSPLMPNSSSGENLNTQAGMSDLSKGGSSMTNRNSTDTSFLGKSSTKGVTIAIALSAVAILLGALVMIKLISSYCRKRSGLKRLHDTFIVVPTTPPASHPKNQAHGGVCASPAPTIFTSNHSSTYVGSPRSPTHYSKKNSLLLSNDYGSYHPHTRQETNLSMAEYIQPSHHFVESRTCDGSRPSPALVWR